MQKCEMVFFIFHFLFIICFSSLATSFRILILGLSHIDYSTLLTYINNLWDVSFKTTHVMYLTAELLNYHFSFTVQGEVSASMGAKARQSACFLNVTLHVVEH